MAGGVPRNGRPRPAMVGGVAPTARGQANSPAARPYLRRLALRTIRDTAPIAGATVNQSPMVTTIAVT